MNTGLPEKSIQELVQRMREKMLGTGIAGGDGQGDRSQRSADAPPANFSPLDWTALHRHTAEVERRAYVWTTKAQTGHYPAILRPFAALFGKMFLFFAQVVTKPQQAYNTSVLESIHALHESLRAIEKNFDVAAEQNAGIRQVLFMMADRLDMMHLALRSADEKHLLLVKHLEYLEGRLNTLSALDEHVMKISGRVDAAAAEHGAEIKILKERLLSLSERSGQSVSIEPRLAELQKQITAIEHRAEKLENATGLQLRIDQLERRSQESENRAAALDGRAGVLSDELAKADSRASLLEGKFESISALQNEIEILEQQLRRGGERTSAIEGKLESLLALERDMTAFREQLQNAGERTSAIEGKIESIVSLQRELAALGEKLQNAGERTSLLEGKLESLLSLQRELESFEAKLQNAGERTSSMAGKLDTLLSLQQELAAFGEKLQNAGERTSSMEGKLESLASLQRELESFGEKIRNSGERTSSMEGRLESILPLQRELTLFQGQLQNTGERTSALEGKFESFLPLRAQLASLQEQLQRLMGSMVMQERRTAALLDEARKRLPEPFDEEQLQVLADERAAMDGELYVAFENKFRGSHDEIKARAAVYLPFIDRALTGDTEHPVLDLGCGRGEWLELLKERGFPACGIDTNRSMVEQCAAFGFDVRQGDVLDVLRALREESLGAVTGFHLIEHLPFNTWVAVCEETLRVLKHGGVAIFETPNPDNVLVGSNSFYMDPSHRNPMPPALTKFIAEVRGFCNVEVLPLHPAGESQHVGSDSEVAHRFNHYFYGPQDYAVIAWKA